MKNSYYQELIMCQSLCLPTLKKGYLIYVYQRCESLSPSLYKRWYHIYKTDYRGDDVFLTLSHYKATVIVDNTEQ